MKTIEQYKAEVEKAEKNWEENKTVENCEICDKAYDEMKKAAKEEIKKLQAEIARIKKLAGLD